MRVGAERQANAVPKMERHCGRGTVATAVRMFRYPILPLMLAVAVFLTAGFGIAPVAAAERAQRSEGWLAADATSDRAGEPGTPEIAKIVRRLKPKTGAMVIAWSPDSKLLATMGGIQGRITLWDPRTGQIVWDVLGERTGSEALAFSNDGRLLLTTIAQATAEDQNAALSLWDVATGTAVGRIAGFFPNEGGVANFARRISLDRAQGLLAVIASHGPGEPVGIYDMQDWALRGTVVVEADTPESLAFGPDGTLAVGTIGGKIALFDAQKRTLKRLIDTGQLGVESLAYSPGGRYVVSGVFAGPNAIRIWDAADGTLVRSYPVELSNVKDLAWSPDGRYIASASFDHALRLWPFGDHSNPQLVATFEGGVWSVAFSPDGRFLAGGSSVGDVVIAEIQH